MNNETNKFNNPQENWVESFLQWLTQPSQSSNPQPSNLQPSNLQPSNLTEFMNTTEHNLPEDQMDGHDPISGFQVLSDNETSWQELDPLDSEELDSEYSEVQIPGENFMSDHFQTLIKQRLKTEIQNNPPLFPWESQMRNYPFDYMDEEEPQFVPWHFWTAERNNLQWGVMPIPLSENVFAELLISCQEVTKLPGQEGAKIVQVVDHLFPGQSQKLNYFASQVLLGMRRDALASFPTDYDQATIDQQMILSLLAAREIVNNLTVHCYANQSAVNRQWETSVGLLHLQIEFNNINNNSILKVSGKLPKGGSLQLQGGDLSSQTQRPHPGGLTVEIFDPEPDQFYELSINLTPPTDECLKFVIIPHFC